MSRWRKWRWPGYETANNHNPSASTNMESDFSNALSHPFKDEQFTAPVSIRICSYRTRQVDTDGISAKAIIDGLVACGLLADDSPKYVAEVSYTQQKVKNASEEKTVVIITEVTQ